MIADKKTLLFVRIGVTGTVACQMKQFPNNGFFLKAIINLIGVSRKGIYFAVHKNMNVSRWESLNGFSHIHYPELWILYIRGEGEP